MITVFDYIYIEIVSCAARIYLVAVCTYYKHLIFVETSHVVRSTYRHFRYKSIIVALPIGVSNACTSVDVSVHIYSS